jgi:Flp pilus assembly protein TadD
MDLPDMKKLFLLLLCSFLVAGCSKTTVLHNNSRSHELAGLEESLRGGEGSLEKLPVPVLIQQGRELLAKNNLTLARLHFLMALKKDPNAAAGYAGFGDVQAQAGNAEGAEIAYLTALDKLPDFVPAMTALGRLRRDTGNLEGALDILRQAQQFAPDNVEVMSDMAVTLDEMGRHEEAEALHLLATEHRPDLAATFNNLGFHYILLERYPEAIAALRTSLKRNPRDNVARNNLAVAHVLNGEAEKGLDLFRGTVGEAAGWNNIGYIYMTMGKLELAEKAFRRALDLNPRFYSLAKRNLEKLNQQENPLRSE